MSEEKTIYTLFSNILPHQYFASLSFKINKFTVVSTLLMEDA